MQQFSVQPLTKGQLEEAWPVVCSSGGFANIDWWVSDAAELIAGGGGVLVARAPDGRVQGLATFDRSSLAAQRILRVPLLITFELSRCSPARTALLHALKGIARKLDFDQIILPLEGKRRADRPTSVIPKGLTVPLWQ